MESTALENVVDSKKLALNKINVFRLIIIFGVIGLLGITTYSVSLEKQEVSILANLFLLASSFVLIGALVGLLFGIPKSNVGASQENGISGNTNLEVVSDWLTKIIIGFGIAELSNVQNAILSLSAYVKNIIPVVSETVIIAIAIFFPIYGFISGWLLTRIHLTEIFATLRDKISGSVDVVKSATKNIKSHTEYNWDKDLALSIDSSDDINELISNVKFLEDNNQPIDWETYNKLGLIMKSRGNFGVSIQYFNKSYAQTDNLTPLINKAVVYSKELGLGNKAIKVYESILGKIKKENELKARTYYNLACCYSRLSKREKAIEALKKSLDIKQDKQDYLKFASVDEAFKNIEEEEEFQEIVPDYDPKTGYHHISH